MGTQPIPLTGTDVDELREQLVVIVRDLYEDRMAGIQVGDVITTQDDDTVFLSIIENGGLEKVENELGVQTSATGGIQTTSAGVIAKLKTDGGLAVDSDGLYISSAGYGFGVIDCPAGTDPTADKINDTVALAVTGTGMTITGNATTDTITYALEAGLEAIAGLAKTDGNVIVGNGTTWVAESGATARTSLGVGTGDSPTFAGLNVPSVTATNDFTVNTGTNKTLVLEEVVYDDLRVTPGSFDRPGVADPTIVAYDVNGGGVSTYLWQFQKTAVAAFTVQLPHSYKQGTDITCHVHWTPGARGAAENGATVGWKVDYSWANIAGAFPTMLTLDLSDACDGTDHKHQMTPEGTIDGHTAAKNISSMLICNVKRTDTGDDDTWVGTASGSLPMLLEIDFHYQIDTVGSREVSAK